MRSFSLQVHKSSQKVPQFGRRIGTWRRVKIGRNHETNSNSLKKPSKDEDPSVNAIEKKKRPKQMRPWNKGQEKKRETNKSKDKCGICGYEKTHATRNVQQWDNSADSVRRWIIMQSSADQKKSTILKK